MTEATVAERRSHAAWATPSHTPLQVVLLGGAFAFSLTQFLGFVTGFVVLNTNPVARVTAAGWLSNVILAGLVAMGLALWLTRSAGQSLRGLLAGTALGVAAGNILALQVMGSLGYQGHLAWSVREVALLIPAALGLVGFGVLLRRRNERWAWTVGGAALAFHAVAYLTLALITLAHLGPIAVESERINPAPAGGLWAALVGMLTALWASRRRPRPE